MQKLVVFGPIILFFLIFIALILGFLVVIIRLILKGKASAWEGKLVDKLHKTKRDFDTNRLEDYYTLVFKTSEGKTIKIATSKKVYDTYQIGDQAIKKSGDFWPTKIT